VTIPETIYYWDGVVLISDQRIMLGHWLYDPADVRKAEVTKVENPSAKSTKTKKKRYLVVQLFFFAGVVILTILDLGLSDPTFRLVFALFFTVLIGVIALWLVIYLRRTRHKMVFVNDVPDIFLLKIHKKRGVGNDYVYLEKSYLDKIAELINSAVERSEHIPSALSPYANLRSASVYVPPTQTGPSQNSFYFDGLVDIGPQFSRFGQQLYKTSDIETITAQPVLPYASSVLPLMFSVGLFVQSLAGYLHHLWPKTFDFGPFPYLIVMGAAIFYLLWGINSYRTYYLINIRGSFGTHSVYVTADQIYSDTIVKAVQAAIASQPGRYEPSAAATNF
jgi:hypothetical protein